MTLFFGQTIPYYIVRARSLKSSYSRLNVFNGGIRLDLGKYVISKTCSVKDIGDLFGNAELDKIGVGNTKNKCVPIFAVPTTAGTAAEVTINYVITDAEKNRKMVCVDPHDIPVIPSPTFENPMPATY